MAHRGPATVPSMSARSEVPNAYGSSVRVQISMGASRAVLVCEARRSESFEGKLVCVGTLESRAESRAQEVDPYLLDPRRHGSQLPANCRLQTDALRNVEGGVRHAGSISPYRDAEEPIR